MDILLDAQLCRPPPAVNCARFEGLGIASAKVVGQGFARLVKGLGQEGSKGLGWRRAFTVNRSQTDKA